MSFFRKSRGKKDLGRPDNELVRPRMKPAMAFVPSFSSSDALSPSEALDHGELLDTLTEADPEDIGENMEGASEMNPGESSREVQAQYFDDLVKYKYELREYFEQLKELFILLSDGHDTLQQELVKLREGKVLFLNNLGVKDLSIAKLCSLSLSTLNEAGPENWKEMRLLHMQMEEQALTHANEIGALENKCEQANLLAAEIQRAMKSTEGESARLMAENKELMDKLQRIGLEKEQLIIHKHAMELEHTREVVALKLEDKASHQQAGDLAQKCLQLQSQLDDTVASAAASHEQMLAAIKEREANLDELEQANRILEEKQQEQILLREEAETKIDNMRKGMHAEDERQREVQNRLEAEATDLRGKLRQLEQCAHDNELKRSEGARAFCTEHEALRRDLAEAKIECRESRHALAASEKECAKLYGETEVLRAQLQDAVVRYRETQSRTAESKITVDELQRKLVRMKSEIEELNALRSRDLVNQSRLMEEAQRSWDMEKTEVVKREVSTVKDERKKLVHEVHFLKKKLSQAYKLEANLTVSQNQLLVRVRELEFQLALAQGMKWSLDHPLEPAIDGIPTAKMSILNSCRDHSTWLKAEREDLERRQTRCLSKAARLCSARSDA